MEKVSDEKSWRVTTFSLGRQGGIEAGDKTLLWLVVQGQCTSLHFSGPWFPQQWKKEYKSVDNFME